jgi:glyoxylase-like metal-dependent hydrolase (beta-lactamase superfamily II)
MLPFIHGVMHIAVPSHTLPPATTTNSLLIGDKCSLRILTDPSPSSDEVLTQLKRSLENDKPDAILLSHHHPDHHERAPQLARDWGIPILCSSKCQQRLLQRFGSQYIDDIIVQHIQQDDVVTQWQGRDVVCHELAGHDDSMVGLASKNLEWFYVADLVEPGTTVVIPEPEGDMAVYFESLERVISMQPKHIIPSHGLPVLGTSLLTSTLAHRVKREQQILAAYNEGLRGDTLLKKLYPDLAEKLIPYAAQNIRQHLRKLGLYLS